jgi:hypothetical protein
MHARSPVVALLLLQLAAAMQLLHQPQHLLAAATKFDFMAKSHETSIHQTYNERSSKAGRFFSAQSLFLVEINHAI